MKLLDVKRWTNKGLWISIIAFVVLMAKTFGYAEYIPENYQVLVDMLLGILVMMGILNDPNTDDKLFNDDSDQASF